jgi:hypothetical protein
MYRRTPRYDLRGVNIGAGDFVDGPLENWTAGVLRLNGRDQYAVLPHETIAAPFRYEAPVAKGRTEEMTVAGEDKRTVDIHRGNFLIELYFQAEPGRGGMLVSKHEGPSGYLLRLDDAGMPWLTLASEGESEELSGSATLNDGRWHHLVVECDREGGLVTFYVDGTEDAAAISPVARTGSLANEADFYLGRGPEGDYFAGAVEFLRVARGTLADAHTSIGELYAWQFDGPQFRDFRGREPVGARDAGAIEHAVE